jgi:ABC-2 type transport system ATP-binding protein
MKQERYSGKQAAVSVSGLSKIYRGEDGEVTAINDVSFDILAGQVVGLLGPNGAGKTTTVKSILGLVTPTSGTVSVHGIPVHENRSRSYTRVSAVLEGARNVYWRLTVRENLAFFAGLHGIDPETRRSEHEAIIETLGLEAKADEPVRNLSRGMKQKVAFGCTLARETPTIFLDEPMLGLDVTTTHDLEAELRRLAREEGKTIVLTSHDMDVVQAVCDRVIVIDGGEIIADDPVEDLLGAFEAQTYRVRIDGEPTTDLRGTLAESVRILDWKTNAETTVFELALSNSDEFFECVTVLEEANVSVGTFTEIEPDLEDIFVDLVSTKRSTPEGVET